MARTPGGIDAQDYIDQSRERRELSPSQRRLLGAGGGASTATTAPPVTTIPPQNYNPATYEQQLASQLAPGYQMSTQMPGGQYPLPQYPQVQQPGFGNGQFNPNMGLFGSFAPAQGGMFGGLFGGQQ